MKLISKNTLKQTLSLIEQQLEKPTDCIFVGGAALLVLTPDATATKDIDALPSDTLHQFIEAAAGVREQTGFVDINTRSAPFEMNLPENWESRMLLSAEFSSAKLKVFTPAPEDLAIMKVFRFVAKDAEDIAALSKLPQFDQGEFLSRFVEVLKIAIGEPRWHAQSFCMIWNKLYADDELTIEAILEKANLK